MVRPDPTQSAAMLARQLQSGQIDAVELTEAAFEAIAACPDKAIFTELLSDRARKEAKAACERLKSGRPSSVLDGVPVVWKDLFDIKGRVTTVGSVVLKTERPAQRDAGLVAAGAAAGMVSLGMTNMTEFAYSGLGLNPHYGTPHNPNGKGLPRIPGGSSSGAAVAVARRLAPIAIGTDTGGSVRIPAAYNGVVGYKSSTGSYPMHGVFPLSPTLDSLGPLARTVEDCVLADAVLRGVTVPEAKRTDPGELRLLVPRDVVFDDCETAIRDNFDASLRRIEDLGVKVEPIAFPAFQRILELYSALGTIAGPEALSIHRLRVTGSDAERMDRHVARRIRSAGSMSAADLAEILIKRRELIATTARTIGDALLAYPTIPMVAPEIAPLETSDDAYLAANGRSLRNTMLGNFLDWCGVAIPNGHDGHGLPTSFLLSAPHGEDLRLLSAALTLEIAVRG